MEPSQPEKSSSVADSLCQVRGRVTGGDCYRDELVTRVTVMRPPSLPASITASHVITAEASADHRLYLHSGPARVWPGASVTLAGSKAAAENNTKCVTLSHHPEIFHLYLSFSLKNPRGSGLFKCFLLLTPVRLIALLEYIIDT